MDALDLLSAQHQRINGLFDALLECPVGERTACFRQLAGALTQHSILESTHFYSALRRHGADEEVTEAMREHEDVKYRLENVCSLEREADAFRACVEGLRAQLNRHVEEEEHALFPLAREKLSAEELEQMEHAMRGTLRLWEGYEPSTDPEPSTPWLDQSASV